MVSKAKAVPRRAKVAVRKEVVKAGRVKTQAKTRACEQARKALAKGAQVAKETTVDLGQKEEEAIKEKEEAIKEEAIKEIGSTIGGRIFLVTEMPLGEEQRVGMTIPREDKVTTTMAGLTRGAILARAQAMLSIRYQQMIVE